MISTYLIVDFLANVKVGFSCKNIIASKVMGGDGM